MVLGEWMLQQGILKSNLYWNKGWIKIIKAGQLKNTIILKNLIVIGIKSWIKLLKLVS